MLEELPTIKKVVFIPVLAPLARPMRTASGTLPGSALGIVNIETSADVTGSAYIFAYTPRVLRALAVLCDDVSDAVVGKSIDPAECSAEFQSGFRLLGIQGLLGMLIAGIDMALWDALGKLRGMPICTLLGGEPRPMQAYDSYGIIEPGDGAADLERSLELGFKAIKIKLGVGGLDADVASVRYVRDVIGPDIHLMIDYNQSLDVGEALRRAARLREYDIYWMEEPVPAEDLHGHAAVRAKSPIPVQTGENWWYPAGAELSIAANASDYVMPDVMKIGGFTGWGQAAKKAAASKLPVSSHAFVEASAHALSATPTAHWLEYLDKARPLLQQGYDVIDGCVTPRGPGLGIAWNEDRVREFTL